MVGAGIEGVVKGFVHSAGAQWRDARSDGLLADQLDRVLAF